MAYNENLCNRIREALSHFGDVSEKYMFGGMCYMVNGKMLIGVMGDEMMCRIGEEITKPHPKSRAAGQWKWLAGK